MWLASGAPNAKPEHIIHQNILTTCQKHGKRRRPTLQSFRCASSPAAPTSNVAVAVAVAVVTLAISKHSNIEYFRNAYQIQVNATIIMCGRPVDLPKPRPPANAMGKIQLPLKIIRIANQILNCPFYRNIRFVPVHSAQPLHLHPNQVKVKTIHFGRSFDGISFVFVTRTNLTIWFEMALIKARQ